MILTGEPYCGPAPAPDSLLGAWNFDPLVFAALGLLLAARLRARGDSGGRTPFNLALGLLALIFISPLCALSTALFSARVAHHVLLVAAAAPLLAAAFPSASGNRSRVPLGFLVLLHALVLWFWHAPSAYAFGIQGVLPYWSMQASLLGSAFLLWRRILARETGTGAALLALLANVVQMGMLGALLTFAPQPIYEPHLLTTVPFGLSQLEDQQLGGLIMWVPAALPYLAVALFRLADLLGDRDGRERGRLAG